MHQCTLQDAYSFNSSFSTVTVPKVTIIFFELRVVKNFPEKF